MMGLSAVPILFSASKGTWAGHLPGLPSPQRGPTRHQWSSGGAAAGSSTPSGSGGGCCSTASDCGQKQTPFTRHSGGPIRSDGFS